VLYFGIGLLFYVLLWIFVPADSAPPPAAPPASG
jgi:phage shock protein PspC (stress-responsive transcriptional regulator)